MPGANDILVHSLSTSQMLMRRYLEDLKPEEYLHRAVPNGNCVAWLVGHLTLSERRILGMVGVTDLPSLPEGFEKRFSREETAPRACEFGDVMILLPLWNEHRAKLIQAVKEATPEQLEKPLEKPNPRFSTAGQFVNYMSHHATLHIGQITIIRRSLGRPPLV